MTASPSARLPRPTGRPRVPNAGPALVLALFGRRQPSRPGELPRMFGTARRVSASAFICVANGLPP